MKTNIELWDVAQLPVFKQPRQHGSIQTYSTGCTLKPKFFKEFPVWKKGNIQKTSSWLPYGLYLVTFMAIASSVCFTPMPASSEATFRCPRIGEKHIKVTQKSLFNWQNTALSSIIHLWQQDTYMVPGYYCRHANQKREKQEKARKKSRGRF